MNSRLILQSILLVLTALSCAAQQQEGTTFKYQLEVQGVDSPAAIVFVNRVVLPTPQPNSPQVFQPELQNELNNLYGVESVSLGKYQIFITKARLATWPEVEKSVVAVLVKHLAPGATVERVPSKVVAAPPGAGCYHLMIPNVPKESIEQFLRSLAPKKPTA